VTYQDVGGTPDTPISVAAMPANQRVGSYFADSSELRVLSIFNFFLLSYDRMSYIGADCTAHLMRVSLSERTSHDLSKLNPQQNT